MRPRLDWKVVVALAAAGLVGHPLVSRAEGPETGYTLQVAEFKEERLKPVVEKLKPVFDDCYPKLVKRFQHPSRPARKEIRLVFQDGLPHPAHASGGELTFSTEWFVKNPGDLGVMTHELTHVVQAYPRGNPGWLVEGVADYARAVYGPKEDVEWKLPAKLTAERHKYDQGYRVTARFLLWLDEKHPGTVDKLHRQMQEGRVQVADFEKHTGKTVEALWQECVDSFK
jgi:hypothetical protein